MRAHPRLAERTLFALQPRSLSGAREYIKRHSELQITNCNLIPRSSLWARARARASRPARGCDLSLEPTIWRQALAFARPRDGDREFARARARTPRRSCGCLVCFAPVLRAGGFNLTINSSRCLLDHFTVFEAVKCDTIICLGIVECE